MSKTIHVFSAFLIRFTFPAGTTYAQKTNEGECPLSSSTNAQTVTLHGNIARGAHDMLLVIPTCTAAVALLYAGDAESGVSSDQLRRDKNFKQLQKYTSNTSKNTGPKYEVEANPNRQIGYCHYSRGDQGGQSRVPTRQIRQGRGQGRIRPSNAYIQVPPGDRIGVRGRR
jgi:hypothetical protein